MAPTPSSKSNTTTPSSKSNNNPQSKTPHSKHRLNFTKETATTAAMPPTEHPVEVIGRIRNQPDQKNKPTMIPSVLKINIDGKSLRAKTEIGYRDFTLDGVSLSEEDDLDGFYKKFVESRINGVKLGNKCTIMMYGPTGSGKSHTMFGCATQPGIVYKSLRGILGEGNKEDGEKIGGGTFVQVSVLEIYNEEIYDLLSSADTGGGFGFGWAKGGSASKVRLEVMGKKAKNATFISGNEAGKILKEIQKVEKRRIVKSTLCNERSSRSHCMIILDVPTVGGRLMLVDMAGSENIEQAGQNGFEAKMQTAKINQGNIALKRVVESIANGDSHVPFRDSKLTMLLQDSFEDDKSKILMILCASPDPRELHKTIATLEYGAKAKCIVRAQHTPIKEKGSENSSSAVILGSRIEAMDQFIYKLQMENKLKEKERIEAQKKLNKKEEEISSLRAKLMLVEGREKEEISEEEINSKVNEQTLMLKRELERKIQECQKMADEFVEMERRKMEERMLQQQREVEMLRHRLEEIESELHLLKADGASADMDGSSFMKRLLEVCSEDSDMVKSMDLDRSIDMETSVVHKSEVRGNAIISCYPNTSNFNESIANFPNKAFLSTVYEEDEEENQEQDKDNPIDEEVQKEVIEEKKMIVTPECSIQYPEQIDDSSRQKRIQNIFTLCGNYRELSQHNTTPVPTQKRLETIESLSTLSKAEGEHSAKLIPGDLSQLQNSIYKSLSTSDKHGNKQNLDENKLGKVRGFAEIAKVSKENHNPVDESAGDDMEVYVKWEASKENPGKFIATFKFLKDSTLAELRKLIEIHFGGEQQEFAFLLLGDPSGAPIPREKEATTRTGDLPICNNGHLACLRPLKPIQRAIHLPFSPLENKLAATPNSPHVTQQGDCYSPKIAPHLSSTPFIPARRY
ncbi:kinesin KIN-10A [Olea europaea subsp. europaea]|uniref:Kinesin-like protein KIN-10A n=1 Tax=Olea europaea subsp. europaea TaxID=158383 RepID=A0A8S0RL73_OLEEU|nr:kinesin KIN-10A [Olea europaea subsp. europaea]